MKTWTLILAAVASVVACDGSPAKDGFSKVTCQSGDDIKMSCTWSWQCQSLGSTSSSYESTFQASCVREGGIFAAGPCPAVGRVAGCVNGYTLSAYYSTPDDPVTAENVAATCASFNGTYCP
jgi:hypothetical protein